MGRASAPVSTTMTSRKNKLIALAVVLVVATTGYLVIRSQATGWFASNEPEAGTLSGNAVLISDSSASGGKAVQFQAPATTTPTEPTIPTPTTPPAASTTCKDYPTPTCVGMLKATTKTSGSMTITENNAVIDGYKVNGGITIRAKNVTIKNSVVTGQIYNWTADGDYSFTVMDSTVGPESGCGGSSNGIIGANNFTAVRVHVRNTIDGVRVSENNRSTSANVTIKDSFISVCSSSSSDHSDGIQIYGEGRNVVIDHNTVDQRKAVYATAPIFGGATSATINNNLVMGGGYGVQIYDVTAATKVTNNKIVDGSWNYSPLRIEPCLGVSGNTRVAIDTNYTITATKAAAGC